MVPGTWAAGIAHAFSVPGQAHRLLVDLGRRQIRDVATGDLGADITTLDRLIVDLAHFYLPKQSLVEGLVGDRVGSFGRWRANSTNTTATTTPTTTTLGPRQLLQEICPGNLAASACGCTREATHHRGIIGRTG